MIQLSEEQGRALEKEPLLPPRVVDPRTKRAYVLLSVEQYEQIENLLAPGPLTEKEQRTILQGVWRRAGWDDPRMEDYQALDPRNKS